MQDGLLKSHKSLSNSPDCFQELGFRPLVCGFKFASRYAQLVGCELGPIELGRVLKYRVDALPADVAANPLHHLDWREWCAKDFDCFFAACFADHISFGSQAGTQLRNLFSGAGLARVDAANGKWGGHGQWAVGSGQWAVGSDGKHGIEIGFRSALPSSSPIPQSAIRI
jgi:hypothetical protein